MGLLENQQAAETIDSVYIDLEVQIMRNIAKHLADWKQPIDSDQWLLQKLAELGTLNQENIRIIARMSGLSFTAAEKMLNKAAEKMIQSIEPGFRYLVKQGLADEAVKVPKSKNVKQVMKALQKQAKDALNLTNTTMLHKAQEAYKKLLSDVAGEAHKILNNNAAAVITGAESRQRALQNAIRRFNEEGITGFVDKKGRNWTPEAYVNMCMRNTAKNVAEEVQTARCLDHGINLIAISSHSGARPKCARDQGKIFDLNNGSGETEDLNGRKIKYYPWKSSSYGEPDGILGINCHHHKFPFVPGVSIQRYFPTEDFEENNRLYKETQVQRALERSVRKQKRECMLYDTLGDTEAFEQSAVRLKGKEAQLKHYVDSHKDLHRRKDREQVVGFDKRISAEAVAKAQKHYKDWAKSIGAEVGPKKLAGYYDLKYNDSKESRLYNRYVDAVKAGRISPNAKYDNFKKQIQRVEDEIVGMTTSNGIKITSQSNHFVERVLGTMEDPKIHKPRSGVSVSSIKDALSNPLKEGEIKKSGEGNLSQKFIGEKATVTVNPETGILIQCNPTDNDMVRRLKNV